MFLDPLRLEVFMWKSPVENPVFHDFVAWCGHSCLDVNAEEIIIEFH